MRWVGAQKEGLYEYPTYLTKAGLPSYEKAQSEAEPLVEGMESGSSPHYPTNS